MVMRIRMMLLGLAATVAVGQIPVKVAPGRAAQMAREGGAERETFSVDALSGQVLLIELNAADAAKRKPDDKLTVSTAWVKGAPPMPSSLGDEPDTRWMSVIPKPGTYRITVERPSKEPYDMRVTLMDVHDRRIDPGIPVAKVSAALAAAGGKGDGSLKAFDPPVWGGMGYFWPADFFVSNDLMGV